MASHLTGPAKDATHDAMPDIDSQAQDTLYRQLGALPADKVGPVFRAMMRGVRPKLS